MGTTMILKSKVKECDTKCTYTAGTLNTDHLNAEFYCVRGVQPGFFWAKRRNMFRWLIRESYAWHPCYVRTIKRKDNQIYNYLCIADVM